MNLARTPGPKQRWRRAPKTALDLPSRPFRLPGGGLGGHNSAFAPLPVGGPGTTARVEAEDEKSRGGEPSTPKDVKNEGRSGNVYENKGPSDTLPDTKGDICARLHVILHGNTRILQKSPALVSQFERWRTHRSLQNEETRVRGRCLHLSNRLPSRVRIVQKLSSWLNRLAKRRGMEPTVRWSGGGL